MYQTIHWKYYIIPSDNWEQQHLVRCIFSLPYYIIPSDNWEQQLIASLMNGLSNYIIPSDNWEQQRCALCNSTWNNYIIPSDNWEQQLDAAVIHVDEIISYQAITGNNNSTRTSTTQGSIISYQAITGNNNQEPVSLSFHRIISYQAITSYHASADLRWAIYHRLRRILPGLEQCEAPEILRRQSKQ